MAQKHCLLRMKNLKLDEIILTMRTEEVLEESEEVLRHLTDITSVGERLVGRITCSYVLSASLYGAMWHSVTKITPVKHS